MFLACLHRCLSNGLAFSQGRKDSPDSLLPRPHHPGPHSLCYSLALHLAFKIQNALIYVGSWELQVAHRRTLRGLYSACGKVRCHQLTFHAQVDSETAACFFHARKRQKKIANKHRKLEELSCPTVCHLQSQPSKPAKKHHTCQTIQNNIMQEMHRDAMLNMLDPVRPTQTQFRRVLRLEKQVQDLATLSFWIVLTKTLKSLHLSVDSPDLSWLGHSHYKSYL